LLVAQKKNSNITLGSVPAAHCSQNRTLCPLLIAAKSGLFVHCSMQPNQAWDSRPYCCSRHTVYSNLGLTVLLLLTAHSLFILGTHGPTVAHGTQSIHTWDSRSSLLLLTAHSLFILGTHGPTVHGISKPMLLSISFILVFLESSASTSAALELCVALSASFASPVDALP
jgi:hypothetical protein